MQMPSYAELAALVVTFRLDGLIVWRLQNVRPTLCRSRNACTEDKASTLIHTAVNTH